MTSPTLEAIRCSRIFSGQRALANTDLAFIAGQSVALLGPNGAGKSTLLGILATLVRPSTGEVRLDGQTIGSSQRSALGLAAHETLCYGDLTGRENLALFARLYSVSDRTRVDGLLDRLDLLEAADRPARSYSRGMQQRLALARALLHRPRILLLDEPFSGLDSAGVELLRAILAEERTRGTLLITITHDLGAIAGLVDRAIVLRYGRVVFDGPAPHSGDELRALYAEQARGVAT